MFHEAMHQWDAEMQRLLLDRARATGKRLPPNVSHAMIFYTAGEGVKAVDVFAEFEKNMGLLKDLVRAAIGRVAAQRTCGHCLPHVGVALPFELP